MHMNYMPVKGREGFLHGKCLSLLKWHKSLFSCLTKAHSYPRLEMSNVIQGSLRWSLEFVRPQPDILV